MHTILHEKKLPGPPLSVLPYRTVVQYSVDGLIPDSKIFWPTKAEISGICSDIYFLGDRVENG